MSSKPKNVEPIRRLVHEDRQRSIKDIATIVNVSYIFPKMKLQLEGRHFDTVEEIQRESQNVLGRLREQHAFLQWQQLWD